MILQFTIEIDVPDQGDWVPYVKQQLLGQHNPQFQVKSVVNVTPKKQSWFEDVEYQFFCEGGLDL